GVGACSARAAVACPLRRTPAAAPAVRLTATFQGCQDGGICYPPMTRAVEVALPAGTVDTSDGAASARPASESQPPAAGDDAAAEPGPAASGSESLSPERLAASEMADGESDSDPTSSPPDASADNAARTVPPASALPAGGALGALLLALLGGLVLNLMPCVLPILSLKVLGLAQSGESRARARSH